LVQGETLRRLRPGGKHAVWAYCHVPHGSTVDMSERITAQLERFAPGFRDRILAVSRRDSAAVEAYNPNYLGDDINGGVQSRRVSTHHGRGHELAACIQAPKWAVRA
jgi:phytoene dehydrogenase-like protein